MRREDLDNPDLQIDSLMSLWPETIPVFMRHQMLCVGCLVNPFHTVIDACKEYDLDEQRFRLELREAIGD